MKFEKAAGASRYCIILKGAYVGLVYRSSYDDWTATNVPYSAGSGNRPFYEFGSTRNEAAKNMLRELRRKTKES